MTLRGPFGILGPDFREEQSNVVLTSIAGVTNVLAVIVARLKGVVLQRDEVKADVIEAGFSSAIAVLPLL